MDIWDWLDPWWAWWAEATDLLDWDAVGAIGTIGGFIAAVWVAMIAIHDRRRRDAAVLLAARHPMLTSADLLQHCLDNIDRGIDPQLVFQTLLNAETLAQRSAEFESFPLMALPSARAVDPFVAAKSCVAGIPIIVRLSLDKGGDALSNLPDTFREFRDQLRSTQMLCGRKPNRFSGSADLSDIPLFMRRFP